MNKAFTLKSTLATAALLILPITQAQAITKAEYDSGKDRVAAQYKADRAACDALKHNEKDVCVEQAKGKEKAGKADLEYAYSGKEADRISALEAHADANYDVAKERCDDLSGNGKDVCVREAQSTHTAALADAKAIKKIGEARKDAAEDKREAAFKLAMAKCDALAGGAKASCVAGVKADFSKS